MLEYAMPSRRVLESFLILALTLITIALPLRTAWGAPGDLIDDFRFASAGGISTGGKRRNHGGGSLFGPNIFVVKLDAQGVHQWSDTYDAANLKAIDVSSAGMAITGRPF